MTLTNAFSLAAICLAFATLAQAREPGADRAVWIRQVAPDLAIAISNEAIGHDAASPTNNPTNIAQIVNPVWIRKPNGDDYARNYPERARKEGVEGSALTECIVSEIGTLTDCKVIEESPTGYGFGQATLNLLTVLRMEPLQPNGKPIASRWTARIGWILPL